MWLKFQNTFSFGFAQSWRTKRNNCTIAERFKHSVIKCVHMNRTLSVRYFFCVSSFLFFFSVLFRTVDCFLWINFKRILIQTQVARLQNEYTIKQSRTKMFKRGRTTKINCTIKKNNVFFFSMKYEISMREWDFRICRTSTSVVLCSMWRPNTKSNERNNIFFL